MRLEDIGKSVGVTNVTVIRFAKKLGYESFGAFKKELQNYVQMMVIPARVIKSEISNFREAPAGDFVRRAIQDEFDLMRATYDAILPDLLIETAEIIKNARKIYIVGTGLNEPITEILLTRLRFLCINAQIVCNDNATLLPYYLLDAGPEDAFIIFSFPNYKSFAINVAKCAQELGCHTICITDKTTAPTAYYAEKLLLCQTSSLIYYNSHDNTSFSRDNFNRNPGNPNSKRLPNAGTHQTYLFLFHKRKMKKQIGRRKISRIIQIQDHAAAALL